MFTGLIQDIGTVTDIIPLTDGKHLTLSCSNDYIHDINCGDSIAINGVCSTVTQKDGDSFSVDYLEETCNKTTVGHCHLNDKVNLEKSATPTTALGGHYVSGHIDETGILKDIKHNDPWTEIYIEFSKEYAPYLIPKGSITIDGISLTLVSFTEDTLSCHIIPHTLENTTLQTKTAGMSVNIEYDMIGKYLYRFYTLEKK